MLEAKLVVVGGDAKSSEVRLKLPTVVGRGKEAGLTVPHALVSRQHTEIFERDGKLYVRDLGSLNGTFVNNLKIEGEQLLGPNQLLTLGNITFRAVYEVAAGALEATENSETVSFDEVKTQEVAPSAAPAIEIKSDADNPVGAIDINETVPVDEFKIVKAAQAEAAQPRKKVELEPVKKEPVKKAVAKKADAAKAQPVAKSEPKPKADPKIELDEKEKDPSAKDTDKSFKSDGVAAEEKESISSIFSFGEEADQAKDKSVALGALEGLPPAVQQTAASFVGGVDLGDEAKPVASQIEPVEIDLGVEKKPAEDDDDPGLGSFLSKLPR